MDTLNESQEDILEDRYLKDTLESAEGVAKSTGTGPPPTAI